MYTRVYQKPDIPPCNFHNPSIFKSMITTEINRSQLLNSNDTEFFYIMSLLYDRPSAS